MFAKWMESCRTSTVSKGEPRYVVQCNGLEVGMNRAMRRDAQAGAVRRGRRLLRRAGAARDALRARVQRPVRHSRGRQRPGGRLHGEHRVRAERLERERQVRGHDGASRLRRRHGCRRLVPAAAQVLVEVEPSDAPHDHPADFRRGPRSGQRAQGGLGARSSRACRATARH